LTLHADTYVENSVRSKIVRSEDGIYGESEILDWTRIFCVFNRCGVVNSRHGSIRLG